MSNIKENRVSAIQKIKAPDGTTFDALKGVPGAALQSRGHALVEIRRIVGDNEPENLHYLDTTSTSFEYATSKALIESRKPEVKTAITRVLVEQCLEEGRRDRAVGMLAYAEAAKLPLPEYDEKWIIDQYNIAKSENGLQGLYEAWWITKHMIADGDKIIRSPSPEWVQKETEAFKKYATEFLKQAVRPNDDDYGDDLRFLFDTMKFRNDGGYNSEQPSDLAIEIADKMIEWDLATEGREFMAVSHAMDAGKSKEEIDQLSRLVPQKELTEKELQLRNDLIELLGGSGEDESNA